MASNCFHLRWAALSLTFYFLAQVRALKFKDEKIVHTAKALSQDEITYLASLTNETYFTDVLRHIMVPRVVGTPSHDGVKQFIVNELADIGWSIEIDDFQDWTPNLGRKDFSNIVARLNPNARRFLVLACHYDSKYFPNNKPFLGATDSAVPCAMMIHLAKVLAEPLEFAKTSDISLMLIFFDGEEAFEEWNDYDSIYGARNLAKAWGKAENSGINRLDRMDMLVLLDLLGAKDPQFYSYFGDTARWHSFFSRTEKNMKAWSLIPPNQPQHFLEKSTFSFIEDDHIPFMRRGVPILHVIPHPFPKVWHKMSDNMSALDFPTITTLNKLFQVFVLSYLSGGANAAF